MVTALRTILVPGVLLAALAGCNLQQQKQLEQQNEDLRTNLRQNKELLDQAITKDKKQQATIADGQTKTADLEKQHADLKMQNAELRKQKDFVEAELARTKADLQKQIRTLTEQLKQANESIKTLQARVDVPAKSAAQPKK